MALILTPEEAAKLVKDHSRVMIGGFVNVGNPKRMIDCIAETEVRGMTVIANDLGTLNVDLAYKL